MVDKAREKHTRIQPRHRQPRRAKHTREDKHEARGRCSVARRRTVVSCGPRIETQPRHAAREQHGDTLACGAPVQSPAAADAVEREDADEGGEHVEDVVEAGDPLRFLGGEAGHAENCWCLFSSSSMGNPCLGEDLVWWLGGDLRRQ